MINDQLSGAIAKTTEDIEEVFNCFLVRKMRGMEDRSLKGSHVYSLVTRETDAEGVVRLWMRICWPLSGTLCAGFLFSPDCIRGYSNLPLSGTGCYHGKCLSLFSRQETRDGKPLVRKRGVEGLSVFFMRIAPCFRGLTFHEFLNAGIYGLKAQLNIARWQRPGEKTGLVFTPCKGR